ncbi:hypothetical protein Tco_0631942, partial [Tanacetum coccineum]
ESLKRAHIGLLASEALELKSKVHLQIHPNAENDYITSATNWLKLAQITLLPDESVFNGAKYSKMVACQSAVSGDWVMTQYFALTNLCLGVIRAYRETNGRVLNFLIIGYLIGAKTETYKDVSSLTFVHSSSNACTKAGEDQLAQILKKKGMFLSVHAVRLLQKKKKKKKKKKKPSSKI